MLEANENNSRIIPKSSSIKLTWVGRFLIFFLKLKHNIIMAHYNASEKNQWLLD